MIKSIIQWLKWRIAKDELRALDRYRIATDVVLQWNSMLAESSATARWVRDCGEGKRPYDIEAFRAELLRRRVK